MAGVKDPFAMGCVLSTLGLLALVMNSLIVVRYGRRRVLLMAGLTICGILQLIIAIAYSKKPGTNTTGKVLVALSCLYLMGFNVSAKSTWLHCPTERVLLTDIIGNGLTLRLADRR